MIYLKTDDEIELLRKANLLVSATLTEIAKVIQPGVTTRQLDTLAEEFIRDHGAIPTFKGFPNPYGSDFPASICTSVNEVVVHGIPNDTPLKDGDIVSVDCGTLIDGFCGDSCYTFCVGEVDDKTKALLKTTKESLYKATSASRSSPWRYWLRSAKPLRSARIWSCSGVCRSWHWSRNARGSAGAQLRAAWNRKANQKRPLYCHRADDNDGQSVPLHARRPLGSRNP